MVPSRVFLQIYQNLTPEAQRSFVEEHLASLLDEIPSKKAQKVITAARRVQARYNDAPELNPRAKKREMQILLRLLAKEDKVNFSRDKSNQEEIMEEAIHSLSSWMNKIWNVVYEHKTRFEEAHECLIYALQTLDILENAPGLGDCRCPFNYAEIVVDLKDKQGRTVKYFSFTGTRKLERVILWIWRDLFLAMLVKDRGRTQDVAKRMLSDIEDIMGWRGLERLLYGGTLDSDYDDEDDEDEDDEFIYTDDEEELLQSIEGVGTDDEFDFDSDEEERCCCEFHAKYWNDNINKERLALQDLVRTRLLDIFRLAPNLNLWNAITSLNQIGTNPNIMPQVHQLLFDIAGQSAENLKAALTIYSDVNDWQKLVPLLEQHYHYLRPNDYPILFEAISTLSISPRRALALKYIEKELLDIVQHIHAAVRSVFNNLGKEANKKELSEILKLQFHSSDRRTRVDGWLECCLTTKSQLPSPMVFAAVMMGMPFGPMPVSSLDEADVVAYMDLDKPDPDLDDLKEEFRPQLKSRFEKWELYIRYVEDCESINRRLCERVVELMPFFRGPDVVLAMIERIAKLPGKNHISDALTCLLSFFKVRGKLFGRDQRQRRATKKTTAGGNKAASSTPTQQTT